MIRSRKKSRPSVQPKEISKRKTKKKPVPIFPRSLSPFGQKRRKSQSALPPLSSFFPFLHSWGDTTVVFATREESPPTSPQTTLVPKKPLRDTTRLRRCAELALYSPGRTGRYPDHDPRKKKELEGDYWHQTMKKISKKLTEMMASVENFSRKER